MLPWQAARGTQGATMTRVQHVGMVHSVCDAPHLVHYQGSPVGVDKRLQNEGECVR